MKWNLNLLSYLYAWGQSCPKRTRQWSLPFIIFIHKVLIVSWSMYGCFEWCANKNDHKSVGIFFLISFIYDFSHKTCWAETNKTRQKYYKYNKSNKVRYVGHHSIILLKKSKKGTYLFKMHNKSFSSMNLSIRKHSHISLFEITSSSWE